MTLQEHQDDAIQRSFDLERAVETIEKQEALIKDLERPSLHIHQE